MTKEKENIVLVHKIIKSKYKNIIFSIIKDKPNFMQKDLRPYIKYNSHLSRAIKELEELDLIISKTPESNNYKLYEITPKLLEVKEEYEKYIK